MSNPELPDCGRVAGLRLEVQYADDVKETSWGGPILASTAALLLKEEAMTDEQRKLFEPRRDSKINPALLRITTTGRADAICAQRSGRGSVLGRRRLRRPRAKRVVRGTVIGIVLTISYPGTDHERDDITLDRLWIDDTAAMYFCAPTGRQHEIWHSSDWRITQRFFGSLRARRASNVSASGALAPAPDPGP